MKRKIFIVTIAIALGTTSFLVAAVVQRAYEYAILLIVQEQRDHYMQMSSRTIALERAVNNITENATLLQKQKMTPEQKKDMTQQLYALEELGTQVTRRMVYYDEDNTVHMFFAPEDFVVALFAETYNTPLKVEQFVRTAEQGLFATSLTKDQKAAIGESFRALQEEVARLHNVSL